jgi:hypothetical protein
MELIVNDFEFDSCGHYEFDDHKAKCISILNSEYPDFIEAIEHYCFYCGKYLSYVLDKENKKISLNEKCKFPEGIKKINLKLNVPSGKMVIANDLRKWFSSPFDHLNVNSDKGKFDTSKLYESVEMIHCYIGNSCPNVFQLDSSSLFICENKYEFTEFGKKLGQICTDLWWYCIVDYENFKTKFLEKNESTNDFYKYCDSRCLIADVDPGVYYIEHKFCNQPLKESMFARIYK